MLPETLGDNAVLEPRDIVVEPLTEIFKKLKQRITRENFAQFIKDVIDGYAQTFPYKPTKAETTQALTGAGFITPEDQKRIVTFMRDFFHIQIYEAEDPAEGNKEKAVPELTKLFKKYKQSPKRTNLAKAAILLVSSLNSLYSSLHPTNEEIHMALIKAGYQEPEDRNALLRLIISFQPKVNPEEAEALKKQMAERMQGRLPFIFDE